MSQPTISVEGRRVYIQTRYGDPCISALKRLGAHWEPQEKRWWLTSAKKAEVEAAVAASAGKPNEADAGAGSKPDEDCYLGANGERLVRGCGECARLGRMCRSCAFDIYDNLRQLFR